MSGRTRNSLKNSLGRSKGDEQGEECRLAERDRSLARRLHAEHVGEGETSKEAAPVAFRPSGISKARVAIDPMKRNYAAAEESCAQQMSQQQLGSAGRANRLRRAF